ncbi:helix-turn-helix domain-containing protein [Yoonia sp. SS1-5]|uniref:Helix-turn-helix domain-containing protein n=1 Tax=Yoonia rhodophyticola TaxID=3137370 RepID=A0AAN0MGB2_9RHOB
MIEYSTDKYDGPTAFAFWRDVICDAYLPIHCETPDRDRFDGRIALERLSGLDISQVWGSPQHIARRRNDIARNAEAYFMVSLQRDHTSQVSQCGRTALLQPGDFAIYSTTEPYEIKCDDRVDQLIFQIPYDTLLARVPHVELLTGQRIDGQDVLGSMISQQLQQCARTVGAQAPTVRQHLTDMMVDLVATGLSTLPDGQVELSRPKLLLLSRAKSTIRANLRDMRLDRNFVGELMGMSPRNLARCFEKEGISIASYIRQARLEAIADDLVDPRMLQASISEIAVKWGMTNFQHLSKLFKQTYGMSPRDYRNRYRLH